MKKFIQVLLLQITLMILSISFAKAATCGRTFTVTPGGSTDGMCQCDVTNNQFEFMKSARGISTYCCGVYENGLCRAYEDKNQYTCGETNNSATVPDGATCNCDGGQWESYWQSKFFVDRGVCCGWVNDKQTQCLGALPGANDVYCGDVYDSSNSEKQCVCGGSSGQISITEGENAGKTCCGWFRDGECKNTDSDINNIEVTNETLNNLNPLVIGSGSAELSTPGGIISKALRSFVFPIAGIILFVVLLLGGFQMLAGANNSKSLEEGKTKITSAIIGFILLFAAYWIAQLLELIFGIRILS